MKQSEAKDFLPLIQAWSEGKELQYYSPVRGWIPAHNPDFSSTANNYRIKTGPVVKEMCMSPTGNIFILPMPPAPTRYKKVRVTIEEI